MEEPEYSSIDGYLEQDHVRMSEMHFLGFQIKTPTCIGCCLFSNERKIKSIGCNGRIADIASHCIFYKILFELLLELLNRCERIYTVWSG
jgi:hypothetical protein